MIRLAIPPHYEAYWCIGDKKLTYPQITRLVASGDELKMIRKKCSGIRMIAGTEVVWFGDDATFIYLNLLKAPL